ncbi:hypothetical protein C453_16108 [Haloferax elongans ATCC BAA-1513]|uniref:Uncharacterized protein n=1 Tax=Haloferax elongans ATCC BAA-1513 TaxID=1230453 RepID=M0HDQ9_HALEO|nr:hypothetical protein [Haloferax elongans]ELZ82625.1 hypothetical protein C453_16108 [Haloferax elongans ATCC BAA-1513]
MNETQGSWFTRGRLLLIAVVTAGIVVPGVLRRLLGEAGYNDLGMVVFVLGYAGMVLVVWYGWIRPLEINGPDDQQH